MQQTIGWATVPPVADVNDVVVIRTSDKWFPAIVRSAPTALPMNREMQQDIGSVAANSFSAKTVLTAFQLQNYQFAQWRCFPIHPFEFEVYEPQTTANYTVRNTINRITPITRFVDPNLSTTEFFTIGYNIVPAVVAYNITASTMPSTVIQFFGWRFDFDALDDRDVAFSWDAGLSAPWPKWKRCLVDRATNTEIPAKWITAQSSQPV